MKFILIAFPVCLIVFPAVFFTLIPKNRNADVDLQRARRLMVWMWIATAAAVLLWFLFKPLMPPMLSPVYVWFAWLLFFLIFFGFGRAILRAKNPDWLSMPPPDVQVRGASLTPRQNEPILTPWAIRAMWLVWCATLAVVLALVDWSILWTNEESLGTRRMSALVAIFVMMTSVVIPALMMMLVRSVGREPEPLDPGRSPELVELYAARRRQRASLYIGLGIAMFLTQGGVAAVIATFSRGYWIGEPLPAFLGWTVLGAGLLTGIAGVALATKSGVHGARINARLRELTQASA